MSFKRNYNVTEILTGFVDSDWGGDESCRKSTSGYVFKLYNNCTIDWSTIKQSTVADSSRTAEYIALYEGVKEALWLKSLAQSVNIKIENGILIYEDSNVCISIASNPTSHKRTKHIDIKYHFQGGKLKRVILN